MIIPYRAYPYFQLFLENDRIPLFETAFNYINFHIYDDLRDIKTVKLLNSHSFEATDLSLLLSMIDHRDTFILDLKSDPKRLSITQLKNIAGHHYLVFTKYLCISR